MKKNGINRTEAFLDKRLLSALRETINSSNIFYKREDLLGNWNLICAFMDRMDSAVDYLNAH